MADLVAAPDSAEGPTAAPGAFARQMDALMPDPEGRPGRYRAVVDDRWNCPIVPQGGVMAALAARAIADEVGDPGQALRTLTTVFASAVPAGPVTVDVQVLRRGRSVTQALATVRPDGADGADDAHDPGTHSDSDGGHATLAVFGRTRPGFAFTDQRRPDVPGPDESPSFGDGYEPPDGEEPFEVPYWDQVEGRPCLGHAPWDDWVPERSDCAYWYRFAEPPRRPDGTLDPLALVALCDSMPGSVSERLGPNDQRSWWAPSADLTVHVLGESRSEWVLAHLRAHRAGEGYASGELALWDPEAGLVAFATQVMIFTFPEPLAPELLVPVDQRPVTPPA